MSLAKETQSARALLGKGLLSHLIKILWESVLLTAVLTLAFYISDPQATDVEDALTTFAAVFFMFTAITFLGLLIAAGRYRKRSGGE